MVHDNSTRMVVEITKVKYEYQRSSVYQTEGQDGQLRKPDAN